MSTFVLQGVTVQLILVFLFSSIDIDECKNHTHDCDVNAVCTNTVGSHSCTCKSGFTGSGKSCSGN